MTTESDRPVAAAIDIGSNSIKMTMGRPDIDGGVEQFDWASEVVRLGQGLDESGLLDEGRIAAAIDTLARFASRARELGATRVLAVATEATRAAANGASFLERVRNETGIEVRVVDGQEEAALTFRGLAATTDVTGSVVIADIGGGSTEFIVVRNGAMQAAESAPLGSGRLTDRLVLTDPPAAQELAACQAEADAAVAAAMETLEFPTGAGTRLIVVGGTGEYMARLVSDERNIDRKSVGQVLSRLKSLAAAQLAAEIDIPEARARVLPAGVAIVAGIAERMEPDRIEISRGGIRTGLLMEAFDRSVVVEESGPKPASETRSPMKLNPRKKSDALDEKQDVPDAGFRVTMKTLIAERWDAVWRAIPAALDGTDIEGVHDVRVATRRLRAAMDIAAPVFPQGWYAPLHRTAKEITGALGEVRDRDVLLEALRADWEATPLAEHPGIDRLIGRVEHERTTARVEMERYLRDLLDGTLWREIERRFGSTRKRSRPPDVLDGSGS